MTQRQDSIGYEKQAAGTLLKEDAAAQILGVTTRALQAWRNRRQGPRYIKVGWRVRYRAADIEAYLDRQTVDTLPGPSPRKAALAAGSA